MGSNPLSYSMMYGKVKDSLCSAHEPVSACREAYEKSVAFGSVEFSQFEYPAETSSPLSHFQSPFLALIVIASVLLVSLFRIVPACKGLSVNPSHTLEEAAKLALERSCCTYAFSAAEPIHTNRPFLAVASACAAAQVTGVATTSYLLSRKIVPPLLPAKPGYLTVVMVDLARLSAVSTISTNKSFSASDLKDTSCPPRDKTDKLLGLLGKSRKGFSAIAIFLPLRTP